MNEESPGEQIMEMIRDEYLNAGQSEFARTPSAIANSVARKLDPENLAPPLIRLAVFLRLRQMARSACRAAQKTKSRS